MSESKSRSILEAVAAGDISPSEASELLDAVAASDSGERTEPVTLGSEPAPPPVPAESRQSAARLPVFAALWGGPITISCTPDTETPRADGPASVAVGRTADHGYTVQGGVGEESVVLLPADLDLRIEANGSDFTLTGLHGTVAAELNVGNVLIEGCLADGESRIEANAGNINLRLLPGSDLEVISRTPTSIHAPGLRRTGQGRWSLGNGTAKLEVFGNLGTIMITAV